MKVLISGGAGYIGSTIASALLDGEHTPVLLDSLVTGRKEFTKDRIFYEADIADRAMVRTIFSDHPDIEATIHCAALIVVGIGCQTLRVLQRKCRQIDGVL